MYLLIFSHVVFNLLQTKKSEIEEELSRANDEIALLKQSGGDNTASIQSLQAQVHYHIIELIGHRACQQHWNSQKYSCKNLIMISLTECAKGFRNNALWDGF